MTAAAVASLTLGIGANTTIFSLIDAVVLRPLPLVARSDRLVSIVDAKGYTVSNPTFRDFASATHTIERLAAFAPRSISLTTGRTSTVTSIEVVSGSYFRTLGVGATVGRPLGDLDDRPGGDAIVLSSAFWRQSFGADPGVVGRRVLLTGAPFVVVGVAAEGFKGLRLGTNPAGWIAISAWPRVATGNLLTLDINMRGWGWLQMVGRLRDGTSLEQARLELNDLARRQTALYPSAMPADFQVELSPLRRAASGIRSRADLTRFVVLLVGLVLAVLGVACANVSGLLVARTLARRRELAIRAAIGASRKRIALELLWDAVWLAALASIGGVLVAMWTIDLLRGVQLPGGLDMSRIDVRVSGIAIGATALLALVASLAFGVAPAIQAARQDVVGGLKDQPLAGRASRQLLRGTLVSAQVMLSFVLLVSTMLFARTLHTTLSADLGFDPSRVAYAATNVSLERYEAGRAAAFYRDVLDRVRAVPHVKAAAWTHFIPGSGINEETVDVPGYSGAQGKRPTVFTNLVTSGYFETLSIPVMAGRSFSARDTGEQAPLVMVNETAARTFWKGDAVGRRFSILNKEVTVIGVARDVAPEPGAPVPPTVYGNALQLIEGATGQMILVARTDDSPAAIVSPLTEALRAAGPAVPVLEARTMNAQLLDVLGVQRSAAALLSLLSVVALVLSAGGVYAMVAFWVAERTREFGVRMALGASSGMVRRLALKHAALAVVIGLAAGFPIALLAGRAARGLLFQLSPADPISFAGATLLLMFVALLASLLPAQRAARTDPLTALRAGTE